MVSSHYIEYFLLTSDIFEDKKSSEIEITGPVQGTAAYGEKVSYDLLSTTIHSIHFLCFGGHNDHVHRFHYLY